MNRVRRDLSDGEKLLITCTTDGKPKTITWNIDNVTRSQVSTCSRNYLIFEVGNYIHKWIGTQNLKGNTHVLLHGDPNRSALISFTIAEWLRGLSVYDVTFETPAVSIDESSVWAK